MPDPRILILQEQPSSVSDRRAIPAVPSVAFDFVESERFCAGGVDLSRYSAALVPYELARTEVIGILSDPSRFHGPAILYRGDPPLCPTARWILLETPIGGDPSGAAPDLLLAENLEYYTLAALYRQCLGMMSTQDEEKLLMQITDTFLKVLGAESCVIWLASRSDPDEMLIASVRGVIGIDREGSRFFLSRSDATEEIWKGEPFYRDPAERCDIPRTGAAGAHLFVPLLHKGKPIGLVKLGGRLDRGSQGEKDLHLAKIIADHAAAALNTIARLGRIETISLRDPETGAYSQAFLADYFEKERYKAIRFHRPLSLLFLVIENYAVLLEETSENAVGAALTAVVESIRKAVRDSDLVAREGTNHFCIVLPETDAFGAMHALRRLRQAAKEKCGFRHLGKDFSLQPFFMSATCPRDGREFSELLRVAEEKFARQQKSPLHRMRLQDRSFWDAFEALVGKPEHYDLLRRGEEVPYFSRFRKDLGRNAHFRVPRETWLRIIESIAQDVAGNPQDRGLVVAGGPTPEIYKQIFLSFDPQVPSRSSIYIVGQAGSTRFDAENLMYVSTEDEQLRDHEFLLCMKENGSYGLFCRGRGEEVEGFNTADEWLVESMIGKAQKSYLIQGSF